MAESFRVRVWMEKTSQLIENVNALRKRVDELEAQVEGLQSAVGMKVYTIEDDRHIGPVGNVVVTDEYNVPIEKKPYKPQQNWDRYSPKGE